jgi:hypothetical protein
VVLDLAEDHDDAFSDGKERDALIIFERQLSHFHQTPLRITAEGGNYSHGFIRHCRILIA